MENVSRFQAAAEAERTLQGALQTGLAVLCFESDWPLARLTWLEGDEPLQLWTVQPGLEALRDAWVAAGAGASWAARVAAVGRPLAFAFEMAEVPPDFAARAHAAALRYALACPLFEGAEVAGAIEVCCKDPCPFDGLRESLLRLGKQLGRIAERKRDAA